MDEELHYLSFADEKTRLHFLKWQDLYKREKPFQIYIDVPKDAVDKRQHNLVFEEGEVTIIKNVRGHEEDYSLDKNGFCYLHHSTALEASRFYDRDAVEEIYLPECEELLKNSIEGVDQVCIFDWRIRRNDLRKYEGTRIDFNDPVQPLGPATHAHIDQSPAAALRRVQLHLPDEADHLLQGRLRIINIWRPIRGPIQDWPLAICDGSTVRGESLVETDHVRRQYAGCTLYVLSDKNMRWYFMGGQKDDEVILFKNFDSEPEVVPYAPHAAFPHSHTVNDAPPRESIEVRALVFTHP